MLLTVASALGSTAACTPHGTISPSSPWSAQIDSLRSPVNGLVYPPFLRREPTTLPEIAAALDLRALVMEDPQISPSRERIDALRTEALDVSPLHGRRWLAVLARAGAERAVRPADVQALRAMRRPEGYYEDPADSTPTARSRLADTDAALSVIRSSGLTGENLPPTDTDDTATLRWLRTTCGSAQEPDELVACIDALRALGVPEREVANLASPRVPAPPASRTTADARREAVTATYWYVRWAQLTGRHPRLDSSLWRAMVDANAADADYEDLYRLTVVAIAAGLAPDDLVSVRRRLAADTLPDGLVRNPADYLGDVTSTFYALAMGALRGEATADARLVSALDAMPPTTDPRQEAVVEVVRTAARVLAGGTAAAGTVTDTCQAAGRALGPLEPQTAATWLLVTQACQAASADPLLPPPVTPWPTHDPEHVAAVAAAYLVLERNHAPDTAALRMSMPDLRSWVADPLRLPNLRAYAAVASAYVLIAERPDPDLVRTIRSTLDEGRGCPGLPDLYRAEPSQGCDLATSHAATSLLDLVERTTR